MTRAAQIVWWLEQVESTRRAVVTARKERRRLRPSNGFDDELRGRAERAGGSVERSAMERQTEGERAAPLPTSAPAHTVIRGTTITSGQDEERRRSLPGSSSGGSGGSPALRPASGPSPIPGALSGGGGQGSAVARARQLAAGYQPAVIKVVSYARGVARATATGQYVQREEVALETHDGRMLADREAVADEIKAWSAGFGRRADSLDVVAVRLTLHGVRDTEQGRAMYEQAIASGFAGHRYAARVGALPSGELEARLVVAMAGTGRERFRVREERIGDETSGFTQRRLDPASEAAVKAKIEAATGYPVHAMSVAPGASNHGRDGVTYRLNRLIEAGPATDDRGARIANVAETRIAAREWGPSLRSQSSRDTMHVIISAKAGTDVAALMVAAILLCGLGYAEGATLSRRVGGWQIISWALVLASPAMAILALATVPGSWSGIGLPAWAGLAYVSVFSMLVGFVFWYRGLALGGIAGVGQLQLLQPFFGLALASLLLHEPVAPAMIAVTALVVLCVTGAKRFA